MANGRSNFGFNVTGGGGGISSLVQSPTVQPSRALSLATQQPYQTAYTGNYTSYYSDGGQPIPEGNKGLAALAKKAPEVVRKMGFSPAKKNMGGGISSRFPRSSRKLGV